jgi:hypothetical protein
VASGKQIKERRRVIPLMYVEEERRRDAPPIDAAPTGVNLFGALES